jgi:hypothetical protein
MVGILSGTYYMSMLARCPHAKPTIGGFDLAVYVLLIAGGVLSGVTIIVMSIFECIIDIIVFLNSPGIINPFYRYYKIHRKS